MKLQSDSFLSTQLHQYIYPSNLHEMVHDYLGHSDCDQNEISLCVLNGCAYHWPIHLFDKFNSLETFCYALKRGETYILEKQIHQIRFSQSIIEQLKLALIHSPLQTFQWICSCKQKKLRNLVELLVRTNHKQEKPR